MNELVNTTNKTPIEIALQIDDDGMTTAKRLFNWLQKDESHYARWIKTNITENTFADENEYSPLLANKKTRGNQSIDYKITASLAKRIAMTEKNDRGEKARNYFIGCEQLLKKLAEEKHRTEVERAKGIAVRQALTTALSRTDENNRMHGHAYSTYTNLVYKCLFGKNASQLREQYGIDKRADLRDCFTKDELAAIQSKEMLVSGLIDSGWGYDQIKEFLTNGINNKMISA